jgi:DNA-binding IclR family transcriptional regulator
MCGNRLRTGERNTPEPGGSQGSIAKLLEVPKTTAHRMLHSLALAGAIQLATGPARHEGCPRP